MPNKDNKKITKMTRAQLNEMINYQIDQKVVNYIIESQGITLNEASKQLNESTKDGFKALKQACKNQAVKAAIFAATKSLQGATALLDGEAKTDMQSMVNVLMALTADQTGNQVHAYGNRIQQNGQVQQPQYAPQNEQPQQQLNDHQKLVSESKKSRLKRKKKLNENNLGLGGKAKTKHKKINAIDNIADIRNILNYILENSSIFCDGKIMEKKMMLIIKFHVKLN